MKRNSQEPRKIYLYIIFEIVNKISQKKHLGGALHLFRLWNQLKLHNEEKPSFLQKKLGANPPPVSKAGAGDDDDDDGDDDDDEDDDGDDDSDDDDDGDDDGDDDDVGDDDGDDGGGD